jgi:hypothetical protein
VSYVTPPIDGHGLRITGHGTGTGLAVFEQQGFLPSARSLDEAGSLLSAEIVPRGT